MSAVHRAAAQVDKVVISLTGASRTQPGIAVLAGRGLDSVRTIVQRDLQNSDRFTVAALTDSVGTLSAAFDSVSARSLTGLFYVVELQPVANGVAVNLWDVTTGVVRQRALYGVDPSGSGDSRITIHRVSDQIVNWTGGIGIAATRIAFKMKNGIEDAIWRIDNDGTNLVRVSRGGGGAYTMTPAWSPDGTMVSYSEHRDSRWTLYIQKLATGTRTAVTSMAPGDMYGGYFSPDGRSMVFTYGPPGGSGSTIATVNSAQNCCAHELTHDRRNADNVSASYSPNGRHIAYISTRTGSQQVWVMDDDGLNAEQQVPPDFKENGRALDSYSPAWSPDNTRIAFARDMADGGRQLFSWSVGGVRPVRLTSIGRNEDPSWAPDSRHVVFKSGRTGREQLWIYDVETGTFRQFSTPGDARYPAWSRVFGTNP